MPVGNAGFETTYEILCRALERDGKLAAASRYRVYELWDSVVGQRIARHAQVLHVQNGVLTVKTSSPVWAQELTFMKEELLQKLNAALPSAGFQDLRFVVERKPASSQGRRAMEHTRTRHPAAPGCITGANGEISRRTPQPSAGQPDQLRPSPLFLEIQDEKLRKAFLGWYNALNCRTERLLSDGYSSCPHCGTLRKPGTDCPYCRTRRERKAYLQAWTLLWAQPSIGWREICRQVGPVHPAVLLAARSHVEHLLLGQIRAFSIKTKDHARRKLLAEALEKLASVRAGCPFSEIGDALLERILGKKYFKLLKEMNPS
ncbi:MAG TPA: DUF721 domain-containing protein [Firmicutes bacterium]|nr:DUF721 domain-containing protein [Candidatus Fermentithermobacillaceae bacterium]